MENFIYGRHNISHSKQIRSSGSGNGVRFRVPRGQSIRNLKKFFLKTRAMEIT